MSGLAIITGAGLYRIDRSADGLRLVSPYDPAFVQALKATIPATGRRWDGTARAWVIDPTYGQHIAQLVAQHTGRAVELPTDWSHAPAVEPVAALIVELAYLGRCKTRDDGAITASGYVLGNRNARQPDLTIAEPVLRAWFQDPKQGEARTAGSSAPSTLYALLGVAPTAEPDALKTAYRRMARQWHPDVCKEPNAHDMFVQLQRAYEILRDPQVRRKYDAGLTLARRADAPSLRSIVLDDTTEYRAPLRAGLLVVSGERRLGRLIVQTIHHWDDLTRGSRTLVSSWPTGADSWIEEWV